MAAACSDLHWCEMCTKESVFDCGNVDRSQFTSEIVDKVNLLVKDCTFLDCPAIKLMGGTATFENVTFLASSDRLNRYSEGAIGIFGGANVTILRCHFINCSSGYRGGAVAIKGSMVTISESSFYNCTAKFGGAFHVIGDSQLQLNDCSFYGCTSDIGGALQIRGGGRVNASACRFQNCAATMGGSIWMHEKSTLSCDACHFEASESIRNGAVFLSDLGTSLHVNNSTFQSCVSSSSGGGALTIFHGSEAFILDSLFLNCTADTGGSILIHDTNSELDCDGCQFYFSHAKNGGAVHADTVSRVRLNNSRFIGCNSLHGGGSLSLLSSSGSANNCSFHNCAATHGGSVHISMGTVLTCEDCEFYYSFAAAEGGSIYAGGGAHLTLRQTIIAFSTARIFGGAIMVAGAKLTLESSTIESALAGSGGALMIHVAAEAVLRNVTVKQATAKPNQFHRHGGSSGCLLVAGQSLVLINESFFHDCISYLGGGFSMVVGASKMHVADTLITNAAAWVSCAFVGVMQNSLFTMNNTVVVSSSTVQNSGGCVSVGVNSSFTCGHGSEMRNCTTHGSGGAIFANEHSKILLRGCTISNGTAIEDGGGIAVVGDSHLTFERHNNTVEASTASKGAGVYLKDAILIVRGNVTVYGNLAGACGGAFALEGSGARIEQLDGTITTARNAPANSSAFCLLGSGPQLMLSEAGQNRLNGSLWVQDPLTAAMILKKNVTRSLLNVEMFGPPVTLRIINGVSAFSVNVSDALPPIVVEAIDAFGNHVYWRRTSIRMKSIVNTASGCNESTDLTEPLRLNWIEQRGLVELPEVYIRDRPGRYCFEIQAAAGTLPDHQEAFPWPQIQVDVLPCAGESERFDEATAQCHQVESPEMISQRHDSFIRRTAIGSFLGAFGLIAICFTLVLLRKRVARVRRETFARLVNFLRAGAEYPVNESTQMLVPEALRLYYNTERFEIAKKDLKFGKKRLGAGAFGVVVQGTLNPGSDDETDVAIKYPMSFGESAHYEALIEELKIIAYAAGDEEEQQHPNIVMFHGAVTVNLIEGELFVVMELCECSLIDFLHNKTSLEGTEYPPTLSLSLDIGLGIANGMAYLASKGIVHRDLAARNILLDESATPKIADYGLARRMSRGYYRSKKSRPVLLPVQWMALELLDLSQNNRFTTQTDIWSYGVVLWEIFSLGSEPYADSLDFDDPHFTSNLQQYLKRGGKLRQSQQCPRTVYALMEQCWSEEPSKRPSFARCCDFLREFLNNVVELFSSMMIRPELKTSQKMVEPVTVGNSSAFTNTKQFAGFRNLRRNSI